MEVCCNTERNYRVKVNSEDNNQGPVVQRIIRLTSSLMTNSLTVVAKVIPNTLIFLLQKCK